MHRGVSDELNCVFPDGFGSVVQFDSLEIGKGFRTVLVIVLSSNNVAIPN